jgi:hypothetical protein
VTTKVWSWPVSPIDAQLTLDLAPLVASEAQDLLLPQPQCLHKLLIQDEHVVRSNSADSKFAVSGRAELADDDDVQRCIERFGDLVRDHDTTARQAEHVRSRIVAFA